MRRLMISEFITLDGVIEAPGGEPSHPNTGWVIPHAAPGLIEYKTKEINEASAMLLGRVQYQEFSEAWSPQTGEVAERINSIPKYVASTTLSAPLTWNNASLLEGDLVTAVNELKQEDGGPILVHGSATLCQSLLAANLVDDLRLMVFPTIVGGGKTIFPRDFRLSTFRLVETETVMPNVLVHTYSLVENPVWEV